MPPSAIASRKKRACDPLADEPPEQVRQRGDHGVDASVACGALEVGEVEPTPRAAQASSGSTGRNSESCGGGPSSAGSIGILVGEARVAEAVLEARAAAAQPLEREVAERVGAQDRADLLDCCAGARSAPRASACRCRSGTGPIVGGDEMRRCTSRAPAARIMRHDLRERGAAHDRVVDEHDALALRAPRAPRCASPSRRSGGSTAPAR